jgi:SAM-dependent methyltransferase
MKGRESGMPAEDYWETFYDADCIVVKLECAKSGSETVAEFGSGYGTFTLPAAKRTSGTIYAFDIEADLVESLRAKSARLGLPNVRPALRDFVADGTGLASGSVDHVMVYNLLHIEEPVKVLREAFRILKPGGSVSIIHWKYDPSTPRGPSMDIRPKPEQCRAWAESVGFVFVRDQDLSECCNYHYGMLLRRPEVQEDAA